ncbi:MAG: PAS domain S-box protein [Desulfobacteraceae bacterium]|nr:PAS domain S-box protein [Desulfobacteraceae bacterium]
MSFKPFPEADSAEEEQSRIAELQLTRFSLENAGDAIFWIGGGARLFYVNQAACRSLGYSRQELLSMTIYDVAPLFPPEKWPDHWQQMKLIGARTIESVHRAKDGRTFPVEISVNYLEFESTEFHCYFVRDISARKKAETQLRESEERFQLTLDATSDGMWDRNLVNDTAYYGDNWASSLGYDKEDLKANGINWRELLHPEDREQALAAVNAHIEGRTPVYGAEFRLRCKNGDWQWIQARGKVVSWDEQGLPVRFVGTHTDITARKSAEEELKKRSEEIKMFAYSVAHDLKSPAVSLHGLADRLLKKGREFSEEKCNLYCSRLLGSAEQIVALVDKINVFIGAKEQLLCLEDVSLAEVLQLIREEFSTRLELGGIRLQEPSRPPFMRADRLAMVRVLRNLIDNAIKYGGDKLSEVTISCREDENTHIVSVRDDGVGLKKEETGGLFGAFKRKKTSIGICGTGLGLAIVKEIIEQHGGEVWTEHDSRPGVAFCFSVPKAF